MIIGGIVTIGKENVGVLVGAVVVVGVKVGAIVGVNVFVGATLTLTVRGNSGPKIVPSPAWIRQPAEKVPPDAGATISTTISAFAPGLTTGNALGELAPIESPLVRVS